MFILEVFDDLDMVFEWILKKNIIIEIFVISLLDWRYYGIYIVEIVKGGC